MQQETSVLMARTFVFAEDAIEVSWRRPGLRRTVWQG